jgi:hypothetical protein
MSPVSFSTFTPSVALDSNQACEVKGVAVFDVDGGNTLKVTGQANLDGLTKGDMAVSKQKLSVAFSKKGAFSASFDVQNNTSEIEFNASTSVCDKDVAITYKNNQGGKAENTLAASVDINDTNSLKVTYDVSGLSGSSMFDANRATIGYTLKQDDITFNPEYDVASNSITAKVGYKIDAENCVCAEYKQATDGLKITWNNNADIGIAGNLKVEANTTTKDLGAVPTIKVTKTIDL